MKTRFIPLIGLLLLLGLPFLSLAQGNQGVAQKATPPVYGKYGCTASKYRNGTYEFIPRGSFTLTKQGNYTYYGLGKPSSGTFTVDQKGNLHFKGGYFEGGQAEKIDRPHKYFLVFPTIADNRWTCTLVTQP